MASTKFTHWDGEERTSWTAGEWALLQRGDEIANITYAGIPVLRALRFVIRDHDWRTPEAQISAVDFHDDSITLTARYLLGTIDVAAILRVSVDGDRLSCSVDATAASAFWTQRTGLVAQHIPQLAGSDFAIVHPDGTATSTAFPDAIRPDQPATNVHELRWTTGQLPIQMRFDGGVFEMEDQRNWTDASYKTYTPPLGEPAPAQTVPGQRWQQCITVTATPSPLTGAATWRSDADEPDHITLVRTGRSAPQIGVEASTAPDDGAEHPAPPAQFVLVEVAADAPNWPAVLERAARAALPLDVRIVSSDAAAVMAVVDTLRNYEVRRVGVFAASTHVTEPGLSHALHQAVRTAGLQPEIVGGTRTHYTELNRNYRRIPAPHSYTFSLTPQMHEHETAQLVESIPMQHQVTRDANWIAAGAPLHVGPVTLRARVNAVAVSPQPEEHADLRDGYGPHLVPGSTDPRQADSAVASWTVGSAASIAAAGAASITYFEEWGPRGIADTAGRSLPANPAVRALSELAGLPLLSQAGITTRTRVWAIGAIRGHDQVVIVANLTDTTRRVRVQSGSAAATVEVAAWGWNVIAL